MDNRPRSLLDCLEQKDICEWRFGQARALADFVYRFEDHLTLMPCFTDHTETHCNRVEAIVNQMVFGLPDEKRQLDGRAFVPTADEAAYLLSAIWLHDIGMIYGIFPDEVSEGSDIDWERYRDNHEMRTAHYLKERWGRNCEHWESHEKTQLAEICVYHRQRHSLETMSPAQVTGRDGKPVRLRELASLLRIADACHVDRTRTPVDLRNLFRAFGMPTEARKHWGIPAHIYELHFDNVRKSIEPCCYIPRRKRYGLVTVDFQLAVDRIVKHIQAELDTVKPYLGAYSNTAYETVRADISRPAAEDPEKFLCELWPCMLTVVSSASEVSCMVAAILLAKLRRPDELPTAEFLQVLEEAGRLHPYNFLVRRLTSGMESFLEKEAHPSQVRKYLKAHVRERVTACDQTAKTAQEYVDPNDILVVHGYSHEVMTLLTKKLVGHLGQVLVVRCHRNDPHLAIEKEDQRIINELQKRHLSCKLVEMASLKEIFSHFKEKGINAKVLVGVRGVFNGGDVLSTVGNATIAVTAKAHDIPVLVLAEPEKELSDPRTKAEMEKLLVQQVADLLADPDEVEDGGPPVREIEIAAPIDRLTSKMYDTLISVGGVATPEARAGS